MTNKYKPEDDDDRLEERLALRFERDVFESLEFPSFSGDEEEADDLRSLFKLDMESFLSCAGEL